MLGSLITLVLCSDKAAEAQRLRKEEESELAAAEMAAQGERRREEEKARARQLERQQAAGKVRNVLGHKQEGNALLFRVEWNDGATTWESSQVIGLSPKYAEYVRAQAQAARENGTDGDQVPGEVERRRKLLDLLDNARNGLMAQVVQRVVSGARREGNKVHIEGLDFKLFDCGFQGQVNGEAHTNICFYLSATAKAR